MLIGSREQCEHDEKCAFHATFHLVHSVILYEMCASSSRSLTSSFEHFTRHRATYLVPDQGRYELLHSVATRCTPNLLFASQPSKSRG